jgi:hypothetical protein
VVGDPVIISNKPSGSKDLPESVSEAFQKGTTLPSFRIAFAMEKE